MKPITLGLATGGLALMAGFTFGRIWNKPQYLPANPIKLSIDSTGRLLSFEEGRVKEGKWVGDGYFVLIPRPEQLDPRPPAEYFISENLFVNGSLVGSKGIKISFPDTKIRTVIIGSDQINGGSLNDVIPQTETPSSR